MDIRRFIREELGNIISEGYGQKPVTRRFDNLKWKLDNQQKHFLDDFINIENVSEKDLEYASNLTGIPVKNINSIRNTMGSPGAENAVHNDFGRLEIERGNPITAVELGFKPKYRTDIINYKNISKEDLDRKRFPTLADKRENDWRVQGNRPHLMTKSAWVPKKSGMNEDIMEFIKDRIKPKGIIINHRNQIQIDQEPINKNEGFEKSMLSFNKKNETYRVVEKAVNEYNELFNSAYFVLDHVDLSQAKDKCHRTFIELEKKDVNKMIWNEETKSWIRYSSAPEFMQKKHDDNERKEKTMPDIIPQDSKELLRQYIAGELNSHLKNTDKNWLYGRTK